MRRRFSILLTAVAARSIRFRTSVSSGDGFGSGQLDEDEPGFIDEAAIAALLPESAPVPALVPDDAAPDDEPVPAGV